jgi:hypothetical protein
MKQPESNFRRSPVNPREPVFQASEHPLKICVVFDEDASARSADVLIRHVVSGLRCDAQSFRFDELEAPGSGIAAARSASDTDILLLAVRDDRLLPDYVQSWLGLCLGLRDSDHGGALVVLVAKSAGSVDEDLSLSEYLETVAAIGGLEFLTAVSNSSIRLNGQAYKQVASRAPLP